MILLLLEVIYRLLNMGEVFLLKADSAVSDTSFESNYFLLLYKLENHSNTVTTSTAFDSVAD